MNSKRNYEMNSERKIERKIERNEEEEYKHMLKLEEFMKDCGVNNLYINLSEEIAEKTYNEAELSHIKRKFANIIRIYTDWQIKTNSSEIYFEALDNNKSNIRVSFEINFNNMNKYQIILSHHGMYLMSYLHLIPSNFSFTTIADNRIRTKNKRIFNQDLVNKIYDMYFTEREFLEKLGEHLLNADLLKIVYSYSLVAHL